MSTQVHQADQRTLVRREFAPSVTLAGDNEHGVPTRPGRAAGRVRLDTEPTRLLCLWVETSNTSPNGTGASYVAHTTRVTRSMAELKRLGESVRDVGRRPFLKLGGASSSSERCITGTPPSRARSVHRFFCILAVGGRMRPGFGPMARAGCWGGRVKPVHLCGIPALRCDALADRRRRRLLRPRPGVWMSRPRAAPHGLIRPLTPR